MGGCVLDRWTILKFFELGFSVACLVTKTVTDYESKRLFLYLEKISREWSLLNSITWDRVGSAVADATYGGYVIICGAMLVGRMVGELPTQRRIFELILLGVGAILFIAIGSLEFASLDQVPTNLLDNAAICGCLSLVTAFLFLMDMGGPRGRKPPETKHETIVMTPYSQQQQQQQPRASYLRPEATFNSTANQVDEKSKKKRKDEEKKKGKEKEGKGEKDKANGYKKMKEQQNGDARRYGIYGRDVEEFVRGGIHSTDEVDDFNRTHSPVWSNVRRGQQHDIVTSQIVYPDLDYEDRPPSGPGDPGFVQYAAQRWEAHAQAHKTPRQSPTSV